MGEKCTNASSSPSREGSEGMSTAAIAGTVAGIVLAALICCVILAAVVVCVKLQKKRRTKSECYTTFTPCIYIYQFLEGCNNRPTVYISVSA